MLSRAHAALPLTILVLGAGLAGCGSSSNGVASKPASQILAASTAVAKTASSVRVTTSSSIRGAKLTLDASLAKEKAHAQLSLLGIGVEAVRVGDTLYIKGNRAFDAHLESTIGVKVPSGVWLKGPATGTLGQIGAFTDMSREVPLILNARGPLTKGSTVKVNGQSAIELKETAKLYTGTLYVATTGQPYPILLRKTGRETGQTTFTDWNGSITVDPPANAIDISQLEHRAG